MLKIKFIVKQSITQAENLFNSDMELERIVGKEFDLNYDFEDYKLKIRNQLTIHLYL
jgi:hypothetical protein